MLDGGDGAEPTREEVPVREVREARERKVNRERSDSRERRRGKPPFKASMKYRKEYQVDEYSLGMKMKEVYEGGARDKSKEATKEVVRKKEEEMEEKEEEMDEGDGEYEGEEEDDDEREGEEENLNEEEEEDAEDDEDDGEGEEEDGEAEDREGGDEEGEEEDIEDRRDGNSCILEEDEEAEETMPVKSSSGVTGKKSEKVDQQAGGSHLSKQLVTLSHLTERIRSPHRQPSETNLEYSDNPSPERTFEKSRAINSPDRVQAADKERVKIHDYSIRHNMKYDESMEKEFGEMMTVDLKVPEVGYLTESSVLKTNNQMVDEEDGIMAKDIFAALESLQKATSESHTAYGMKKQQEYQGTGIKKDIGLKKMLDYRHNVDTLSEKDNCRIL